MNTPSYLASMISQRFKEYCTEYRVFPSLHGGSREITLKAPFKVYILMLIQVHVAKRYPNQINI